MQMSISLNQIITEAINNDWSLPKELAEDLLYLYHTLVFTEDKDSTSHAIRVTNHVNGYALGEVTTENDSIIGIVARNL